MIFDGRATHGPIRTSSGMTGHDAAWLSTQAASLATPLVPKNASSKSSQNAETSRRTPSASTQGFSAPGPPHRMSFTFSSSVCVRAG
jgi:hypothetical protein